MNTKHRMFVRRSWAVVMVAAIGLLVGVPPPASYAQTTAPRFLGVVQSRTLTTYAYARDMDVENDTDDTRTAPNFGLFNATSRSDLNVSSAFALATASQRSSFSSTVMSATGDVLMSTSISDPNWEIGTARATSTYSITFRVNATSSVRLRGTLHSASPSAANGGKVRIAITSASGTLFSQQESGDPYDGSFDTVVQLAAGPLYTLSATSAVNGTSNQENSTNDSESAYNLALNFLPTTAAFGLMSLNRTIDTHVVTTVPRGSFGDDDSAEAPNTAAWSASVRSAWQQGGASGASRSRQDSKFNPNMASVTLQTAANSSVKVRPETAHADANGLYELRFFVGTRLTVRLKGTITRNGATTTRAVLTDSKGLTLWRSSGASFDQQIVLKPDRAYTFTAVSQSSAITNDPTRVASSSGTLLVSMTIVQP